MANTANIVRLLGSSSIITERLQHQFSPVSRAALRAAVTDLSEASDATRTGLVPTAKLQSTMWSEGKKEEEEKVWRR